MYQMWHAYWRIQRGWDWALPYHIGNVYQRGTRSGGSLIARNPSDGGPNCPASSIFMGARFILIYSQQFQIRGPAGTYRKSSMKKVILNISIYSSSDVSSINFWAMGFSPWSSTWIFVVVIAIDSSTPSFNACKISASWTLPSQSPHSFRRWMTENPFQQSIYN